MWSDPAIIRYTVGAPSTEQRTWMRILAYLGHWDLLDFGYWAIEEKSSGSYIGELGFADFKRGILPSIHGLPELGWLLAHHAHGKGYATEGLLPAIVWGDAYLKSDRTVCLINPQNVASLRLAEKCGYRELQRITKEAESEILFERVRAK